MEMKYLAHHHRLQNAAHHLQGFAGSAKLTYYIFEGILVGLVNSKAIHLSAWTGGGAGSTRNKPNESANNPYAYGLKEVDDKSKHIHVHGGPIPPGRYRIHLPGRNEKVGLSAQLDPLQPLPNKRGGFLIHRMGPHGSDGCIVLADKDFYPLMHSLTASRGGMLVVCQALDSVFV